MAKSPIRDGKSPCNLLPGDSDNLRVAVAGGSPTALGSITTVGEQGIPVIARTLIAELPELGQLTRKRIAGLAGLSLWTRQSGK